MELWVWRDNMKIDTKLSFLYKCLAYWLWQNTTSDICKLQTNATGIFWLNLSYRMCRNMCKYHRARAHTTSHMCRDLRTGARFVSRKQISSMPTSEIEFHSLNYTKLGSKRSVNGSQFWDWCWNILIHDVLNKKCVTSIKQACIIPGKIHKTQQWVEQNFVFVLPVDIF